MKEAEAMDEIIIKKIVIRNRILIAFFIVVISPLLNVNLYFCAFVIELFACGVPSFFIFLKFVIYKV